MAKKKIKPQTADQETRSSADCPDGGEVIDVEAREARKEAKLNEFLDQACQMVEHELGVIPWVGESESFDDPEMDEMLRESAALTPEEQRARIDAILASCGVVVEPERPAPRSHAAPEGD